MTKLEVGDATDPLERDADAVADLVMGMPTQPTEALPTEAAEAVGLGLEEEEQVKAPLLRTFASAAALPSAPGFEARRACSSCDAEDEVIMREPAAGRSGGATSDDFSGHVRERLWTGGSPLPTSVRSFLEPRLGVDLGHLRVHADPADGLLASRINARAFTLGQDIFFAPGQMQPHSRAGMRLLTHEVVHTLQTSGRPPGAQLRRTGIEVGEHVDEVKGVQIIDDDGSVMIDDFGSPIGDFMSGCKKYLGLELIRYSTDGGGTILKIKDSSKVGEKRDRFVAKFPKDMPQTRYDANDEPIEVLEEITPKHAEIAFNHAVYMVKHAISESLAIRTPANARESKDAAAWVPQQGSDRILINKDEWENLRVHKSVREAFDGFWILLHELFHLYGDKYVEQVGISNSPEFMHTADFKDQNLAFAQSPMITKNVKMGGELSQPINNTTHMGPTVSYINILQAGCGLPLRNNYGRSVKIGARDGVRIVQFDFYEKDNENDFVSKPRTVDGVVVGIPQTQEEADRFSQTLRQPRVQDNEKIFEERLASVDVGKLTIDGLRYEPFEPIETSNYRFSALFAPHDESGINIKIIGRWSTSGAQWDIPHVDTQGSMGTFDRKVGGLRNLKLNVEWAKLWPGEDRIHSQGTGRFETGASFYFGTMESAEYAEFGASYIYDRGVLDGSWERRKRTKDMSQKDGVEEWGWSEPIASGTWELVLGGPYMWPIEGGYVHGTNNPSAPEPGLMDVDDDPEWGKALMRLDAAQVESEQEPK